MYATMQKHVLGCIRKLYSKMPDPKEPEKVMFLGDVMKDIMCASPAVLFCAV